jgi:hypothetical protein
MKGAFDIICKGNPSQFHLGMVLFNRLVIAGNDELRDFNKNVTFRVNNLRVCCDDISRKFTIKPAYSQLQI